MHNGAMIGYGRMVAVSYGSCLSMSLLSLDVTDSDKLVGNCVIEVMPKWLNALQTWYGMLM